jgi:hypothetical protein
MMCGVVQVSPLRSSKRMSRDVTTYARCCRQTSGAPYPVTAELEVPMHTTLRIKRSRSFSVTDAAV